MEIQLPLTTFAEILTGKKSIVEDEVEGMFLISKHHHHNWKGERRPYLVDTRTKKEARSSVENYKVQGYARGERILPRLFEIRI